MIHVLELTLIHWECHEQKSNENLILQNIVDKFLVFKPGLLADDRITCPALLRKGHNCVIPIFVFTIASPVFSNIVLVWPPRIVTIHNKNLLRTNIVTYVGLFVNWAYGQYAKTSLLYNYVRIYFGEEVAFDRQTFIELYGLRSQIVPGIATACYLPCMRCFEDVSRSFANQY